MARDGSGNYALPAGNPVATGTTISSTWANATLPDIGTALTNSIAKDGQTTPTANLPMGGNRHTGVSDGVLGTQYASINQTQNGSLTKAGSVANATDAYTGSLAPAIAAYTDGLLVTLTPSATNTTTAVTLALNGLTAKPIQKEGGVALAIGDVVLNVPVHLQYTTQGGGYWMLLNPQVVTSARLTAISDSKLSANVPLLNIINTFTADVLVTPSGGGTAFRVTGIANFYASILTANGTTGQSFGLSVVAGTNSSDSSFNVANFAQTKNYFNVRGDGVWSFDNTNGGSFVGAGAISCAGVFTSTAGFASKGDTITSDTQNSAGVFLTRIGSFKAWNGSGSVTDAAIGARANLFIYTNNVGTPALALTSTNSQFADENTTLQDIGFRGLPQNSQPSTYTCVLSDRGRHIYMTGAGATGTIPSNASVAYPVGTTLTFVNDGSAPSNISINSDTLVFSANNTTGTRTLAVAGMATALKVAATRWFISGAGLS